MTNTVFRLESLGYQTDAVNAVAGVFKGAAPSSFGTNDCSLGWPQIEANLQDVAKSQQISDEHLHLTQPEQGQALDLCIEMETGTGKTLVYLRTIYKLHSEYGWSKFIIVVPSVAVREGVISTLRDFGTQLASQTKKLNFPIPYFEYDSSRLTQLRTFIDSPEPAIMVINSQAFVGQGKVISNEQNEAPLDGLTWLQALARCCPIVVMDEPQEGMDTEAALKAFDDMRPLAKLRYSATHKHARNCVYRLTPAQAYQQGLVKKIEVLTIAEQNAAGTLQLELVDGIAKAGQLPKAKLKLWYRNAAGELKHKTSPALGQGADLAEHTKNPSYAGFRIDVIEKPFGSEWAVKFSNGEQIVKGQTTGDQEGVFRQQLRWLIFRHFEKKQRLAKHHIKCLSLIFIDRVANYLGMGQDETPLIKRLFEEEYAAKVKELTGKALSAQDVQAVQGSYFAQTGQGRFTDNESAMSKNSAIYKRILTDKAGLLGYDDPVSGPIEFIFTHSALGVGWDNPNVFNIATLNHAQSESRKRQEIGRGLRICVNQSGQRVYDADDTPLGKEINLLTVVPNMSYQQFAQSYQQEIEEAYGHDAQAAAPMRHNKSGKLQKKVLKRRDDLFELQAFRQFWKNLARTTHYSVAFDENLIVQDVVPQVVQITIPEYGVNVMGMRLDITEDKKAEHAEIAGQYTGSANIKLKAHFAPQDWVQAIGKDSRLSQKAVLRILQAAFEDERCMAHFLRNPVLFAQQASAIIRHAEREHMLRGLSYWPTGEVLPLDTLQAVVETTADVARTPQRGLYDAQAIDSGKEKEFAEAADKDLHLMCLLKLPNGYSVPTPVGHYTPDFGLVYRQSGHQAMELGANQDYLQTEFFVVEVKATHDLNDTSALREEEIIKIRCAAEHFKALGFVTHLNGRVIHVQPSAQKQHYAAPHDDYDHFKQVDVNTR
jgi:type III restriction enzyme